MKCFASILIYFLVFNSYSQIINFDYDVAGNQIHRTWCANCSLRNQVNLKEIEELQEKDLIKFFEEDEISYYPNPVKEELYIKWDLKNDNSVLNFEIYSVSGNLIKVIKKNFNENYFMLNFKEYSAGVYILNINYLNGERKSIKIIKN